MKITKAISTVEVHTGGEAFRIVTSGLPRMQGKSIVARRAWLKEHADHIRRALMFEPRGHADMYGGYLTEPVSEGADFGVIFVHNEGYSDHCGHGVIGLATAAVELGWIERTSPETRVGIDAPCGFIEAFVQWDGEHAGNVRFVNVPSFIWQRDVTVDTPTFGKVTGDIAFGGAFYFYVDGAPFDLPVRESAVVRLIAFGAEVKAAANAAFKVVHPEIPELNHIYGTIIANSPRHAGSTQANCCVFADREVDRSPTGSGTAGRVAQLYLRGQLGRDETLVNESVIGTVFKGRVLRETKLGEFDAVIPEVEGNAYICGFANWIIDERDPLTYGFLVR
ncbi:MULTISPECIES: trans-3-hydroxy-L-proline dehydratase [unclassified Caballeronia]|uniref:trans-3-hydroxy-L-proline dehydratase n=1 Tax=unclassified Caballeronia TaxID=2646786 RepID=UPI00285DFEAF|nr:MULTISPECIES: trans-3-hydroxy-L-proline dehydratase [unclassified Caballeronia]MDR5752931.1 proline racemase family protein [Caballeronia sp. LZ024]MDR5841218.1 proline racemase family protein [Caballeronia sp. LZ031]